MSRVVSNDRIKNAINMIKGIYERGDRDRARQLYNSTIIMLTRESTLSDVEKFKNELGMELPQYSNVGGKRKSRKNKKSRRKRQTRR
jgi:hypothetical protein